MKVADIRLKPNLDKKLVQNKGKHTLVTTYKPVRYQTIQT